MNSLEIVVLILILPFIAFLVGALTGYQEINKLRQENSELRCEIYKLNKEASNANN